MPLVSVLLPFHLPGKLLSHAVSSICNQTFSDWELVLVNNTVHALNLEQALPDIPARFFSKMVIVHEPVPGISHALNRGLTACSGKWIARMDADDFSLPNRLEVQLAWAKAHPEAEVIGGLVEYTGHLQGAEGFREWVRQVNEMVTEEEMRLHRFVESPLIHPTVLFQKKLIENFGPYVTTPEPEDYELWLRWYHQDVRIQKAPQVVLSWHDHAQRLTRTHSNYSPAAFSRVRIRYLAQWLLEERKTNLPILVCGGGKLAKRKIEILEKAGVPIAGITDLKLRVLAGKKFIFWNDLPPPGTYFLISLVSSRGAFVLIRQSLKERGYRPETDFILAG